MNLKSRFYSADGSRRLFLVVEVAGDGSLVGYTARSRGGAPGFWPRNRTEPAFGSVKEICTQIGWAPGNDLRIDNGSGGRYYTQRDNRWVAEQAGISEEIL